MIDREDMLELTRRMTPKRTSFTRIAGAYIDEDGFIDGTFNIHFQKLNEQERKKNLEIAKHIPYAKTNEELREYKFPGGSAYSKEMRKLLLAIRSCGLKNDAMMETFYELAAERLSIRHPYAILVFHDRYDIPAKGADKERQWESEEMFEYLICAICPLKGEYEPGLPEMGFLYPAFTDRSGNLNHINIYGPENSSLVHMLIK